MTGVPCASLRRWYWIASIIACFWNLSLGGVNHNVVHPALPMIINPTELSILSIQFNPKPGIFSDWVVPTFGEKAVFHNRSYDARLRTKLQPQEIEERSALFKTFFKLPEQALNTSCSFEFLGFVPVNTHRPFTWGDKEYRPSIGVGSLLVGEAEDWDCYYRGLYENPLHSLTQYKNQHWPIVFFCPARNDRISCANALAVNDLAKRQDPPSKLALRLSLPLHDVTWSVDMAVDLLAVQRKDPPKSNQAALCTAIPYTTSIPERFEPNGAMLYEFIRYHAEIGLKVMVFDREGANWPYISRQNYYTHRGRNIETYDFDYYNYTVLDQLLPYKRGIQAESLDGLSPTIVLTDFDKRFSLTYCRFVARAVYGIERVLVLDFDEFIYCPSAKPSAQSQRSYLSNHLDKLRAKGVEQYVMRQRILVSRTPDMQQCLFDQVKWGRRAAMALESGNLTAEQVPIVEEIMRNASIFHCLAAYRHLVRRNFDKSFHLAHVCPYTSFHHSSNLRHFDCVASSYRDFDDGCHAVHYTTKPPNYNRSHEHSYSDIAQFQNELQVVTNTLPYPVVRPSTEDLPSALQSVSTAQTAEINAMSSQELGGLGKGEGGARIGSGRKKAMAVKKIRARLRRSQNSYSIVNGQDTVR